MMVHMLLIPALGGGAETDSVHSVILRKTRDLERKKMKFNFKRERG